MQSYKGSMCSTPSIYWLFAFLPYAAGHELALFTCNCTAHPAEDPNLKYFWLGQESHQSLANVTTIKYTTLRQGSKRYVQ